jgi:hypothetical protein
MSKLKIGITTRDEMSIWSNGLDQNIYFLYKMLEDMNYAPSLISESYDAKKLLDISVEQADIYSIKKFDIILEVAHPLSDKLTNYYNSLGKPLISIKYGNNFMLDLERYINKNSNSANMATGTNLPFRNREIWVSEQFYKFKDYIEVLTRSTVKIIPYIWDSSILRMHDGGFHNQDMLVKKDDFKKIAIVEPNMNVLKNCMVPLAICDMAYDKNKESIKEVYCFGAKSLEKNNVFLNYIKYLNIHKDKVSSYEARYPFYKVFKDNLANTIVSTQLFNEQNYVYLETLFYKRLLIHNSPLFKDVGYYYPEFNINIGSDQLLDAVQNFNQIKHIESYEAKLEEVSIYNEKVQEKTRELIESVIK